jgi:hypothetical protein
MSDNNSTNNNSNNKSKIKTGNVLIDVGLTLLAAAGGAVVGEVSHRVKEVKSRKKARDLAVKTITSANPKVAAVPPNLTKLAIN